MRSWLLSTCGFFFGRCVECFLPLSGCDGRHHRACVVGSVADLTNCFYEFGISFSLLGQTESDALGGALTRFGGVAEKVAIFTNQLVQYHRCIPVSCPNNPSPFPPHRRCYSPLPLPSVLICALFAMFSQAESERVYFEEPIREFMRVLASVKARPRLRVLAPR